MDRDSVVPCRAVSNTNGGTEALVPAQARLFQDSCRWEPRPGLNEERQREVLSEPLESKTTADSQALQASAEQEGKSKTSVAFRRSCNAEAFL